MDLHVVVGGDRSEESCLVLQKRKFNKMFGACFGTSFFQMPDD